MLIFTIVFQLLKETSQRKKCSHVLAPYPTWYIPLIYTALNVQHCDAVLTLLGSASTCQSLLRLCRIFRRSPRRLHRVEQDREEVSNELT